MIVESKTNWIMTKEEQKIANFTLIFCVAMSVISITGLVFMLYKHV